MPELTAAELSEEQLKKVEEFIEEEEGSSTAIAAGSRRSSPRSRSRCRRSTSTPPTRSCARTCCARSTSASCSSCRSCSSRSRSAFATALMWWDVVFALLSVAIIALPDRRRRRLHRPQHRARRRWDMVFGIALILLVLEAMRRTSGWIMPVIIVVLHRSTPSSARGCRRRGRTAATTSSRLVGHLYMTLEGIFGTAVDVSSSLIILFTIYGAFLQYSGAGKFFIDFSFALMGGKPTGAGRTVVLASFLLGGPSGSGVATTVTHRLGGLADARRSRATRRTPRAACSPRAAWARSSRRRCWARRLSSSPSS